MHLHTYFVLTLIYTFLHMAHICLSCVYLLNGWEPKSITQRAEPADIVGVADVLRTFKRKEERAEDGTYMAEVNLLYLYKGHELMSNIDVEDMSRPNVFNVTNFGSYPQCYADVNEGLRYILFLTEYERGLSAQYHDIFGAAESFKDVAEEEILTYLGWNQWSEWSPCSASCGGGQQQRSRECPPRENDTSCVGVNKETRSCNLFSCDDSHDILKLMQFQQLPVGINRNPNRGSTYVITKDAKPSLPVSQIFPVTFPSNFSILFKVKVAKTGRSRSYFFVVNDDIQETQKIAVFLGRKLKVLYLGNTYGFKADLLDNRWHSVGLRVRGSELVLNIDCDVTMKRRLRTKGEYLGTNLLMSIGPYFSQYGRPFVGEVEQLVLSSNPDVASLQCGNVALKPTPSIEILISSTPNMMTQNTSMTSPLTGLPDDACQPPCQNNATCGAGNVCRCQPNFSGSRCQIEGCSIPCDNGGICVNGGCLCHANFTGDRCENGVCTPVCLNGGVCVPPGRCSCPDGFYGIQCQAQCTVPCINGGVCVGNNTCSCPKGYTGNTCEKFECTESCKNGGLCVGHNKCQCEVGYHGPQCQHVKCRPKCKNGGVCRSPGVCACKTGFTGKRCQRYNCAKGCKNGGTCSSSGKCVCPPFFYGRKCQKVKCKHNCLHGGRCKNKTCTCPTGFSGKRCERSSCKYEHYLIPFRRTYRKLIREKLPIPCGEWAKEKKCTKTRLKYVRITKDTYRGAYRCVL